MELSTAKSTEHWLPWCRIFLLILWSEKHCTLLINSVHFFAAGHTISQCILLELTFPKSGKILVENKIILLENACKASSLFSGIWASTLSNNPGIYVKS